MSGGGHIRERGKRSWQIKYDIPSENGGRKTIFKTVHGGLPALTSSQSLIGSGMRAPTSR